MVEKVKTTVKKKEIIGQKDNNGQNKESLVETTIVNETSKKTHPVHRLSGLPAQCNAAWCTAASVWLAPIR